MGFVFLLSITQLFAAPTTEIPGIQPLLIPQDFAQQSLSDVIHFCIGAIPAQVSPEHCKPARLLPEISVNHMKYYSKPVGALLLLKNPALSEQVLVLEHDLAITTGITLTEFSGAKLVSKEAGSGVSVAARDYRTALPAFRIVLKGAETKLLQLTVTSQTVTTLGFTLYAEKVYLPRTQKADLLHALYYGLMLSMILYNLLLFIRLRVRMYLYYVLFVFFLGILYLGIYGHGFVFLWPDVFLFQQYGFDVAKYLAGFFFVLFIQDLMGVRARMPRLYKRIYWTLLAEMFTLPLAFFILPIAFFFLANFVIGTTVVYSLYLAGISVRGKLRFNAYYAIALIAMLIGAAVNLLVTFSLIPATTWTVHALQVGSGLETIFLSIALGDRFAEVSAISEMLSISLKNEMDESMELRQKLVRNEKMAAVGMMAAGIVHDFKNPVHVIKGAAEMADENETGAMQRSLYLKMIYEEAERLGDMAQDILDYTSEKIHIEKSEMAVEKFAGRLELRLLPYFARKSIRFELKRHAEGEFSVDSERLLRTFINIAGNAADVLKEGESFSVSVTRYEQRILFALTDTGPGIPERIRDNLFEPFVTSGKSHGTGLGMAISKSIVEAHGGKIWFETQKGKGTTFFVELPG